MKKFTNKFNNKFNKWNKNHIGFFLSDIIVG